MMDIVWVLVIGLQLRLNIVDHGALSVAKVAVGVDQVPSVGHVDRKQVLDDVTTWNEGDLHWSSAHFNHSDEGTIGFV